jgi:hypothetical protein
MSLGKFLKNIFKKNNLNALETRDSTVAGSGSANADSRGTIENRKRIKAKYNKIKSIKEISVFQQEAINLIMNHLMETDYKNHQALLREVKFLLHYTFEVLRDDYFLGGKFFKTRMTRIDDYIFSQYSKQENLKENIRKLKIVASSNRFDEKPRQNILSYFVFMEETGFEIIALLNDFYAMIDKSQGKLSISWLTGSVFKLNKKYKKDAQDLNPQSEMLNTLMTQQTMAFTPRGAQREIIEDLIEREKKAK